MVAPTATIELYVDGTRVPSTPDELAAGLVTALDNLRLTWGRDGQNEQPSPATVVFDLVDPAGGNQALDVVHVGSSVAVWAQGQIPGSGTGFTETYDDPTMHTFPLGDAEASRYASTSSLTDATVVDVAGARMMELRPQDMSDGFAGLAMAAIPPRRFSPTNELPNAWDDIPVYHTWDPNWHATIRVKAPLGATITLQFRFFAGPYPSSAGASGSGPAVPATGDWQTISHVVGRYGGPSADGRWLGVQPFVQGLRPRWKDQPDISWAETTGAWEDVARVLVDTTSVERPADATTDRRVLVFSGECSDLEAAPWGDRVSTGLSVTAVDLGGQLGHTVVGDTPWAVQTVATRANRVAQLAGITTNPRVRVDTPLDTLQLSARDVDAQPAYALLQDMAQSAGGVLWAATHAVTGPFLWIENPASRAAVRELTEAGGLIIITAATRGVSLLSACDLLEDPVRWRQDSGDVVTTVAVTWAEQGLDDEGQPATTERTVTVTDSAAVAVYGTRRLSISTELISATDAAAYASRVLAQARAVGWRLDGLVLDTTVGLADTLASVDDTSRIMGLLDLLDGTTRMGAAVTLVDMPPYAPRGAISDVYVDGGTYTYTADGWRLELGTTPTPGQGESVTWEQLDPGWSWTMFDPAIQWVDLFGVAA